MNMCRIIAVVGLIGSGKTEAVKRFTERGFERVGFNDVVYEELARRGLSANETNEREVREGLRRDSGMAVMAERSLPKIIACLDRKKNVVVESLYSWSEYKLMRERFGASFSTVAIFAPPAVRYSRLAVRPVRPLNAEESWSRDSAEIEHIEKAGPVAMADWTIENIGTKDDLLRAVDRIIGEVSAPN